MTIERKDPRYFVAMIPDANLTKLYKENNGNVADLHLSPNAIIYSTLHAMLYGDIDTYRKHAISYAAKKMGFYCDTLMWQ